MFKKKSSVKSMSNNTFEKWAKNMKIIQTGRNTMANIGMRRHHNSHLI